jgi:hypothetical protein
MGCSLIVSGDDFDVDEFLARFAIEPDGMFRRGEAKPRAHGRRAGATAGLLYTQSRFWLDVSRREFEDFEGQIQDAITFLSSERWQPMLEALAHATDLEQWLDFNISWPDVETYPLQVDYLPPELVAQAGRYRLGIAVDHYP